MVGNRSEASIRAEFLRRLGLPKNCAARRSVLSPATLVFTVPSMPQTDQPVVEPSGLGLPPLGPSLNGPQKISPEISVEVAAAHRRQPEDNSATPAPLPSPK